MEKSNHILLICCRDRAGIIAGVTGFCEQKNWNILEVDEHVDKSSGTFFMRLVFECEGQADVNSVISDHFENSTKYEPGISWALHNGNYRQKMAIFVSKMSHCFFDILARHQAGELNLDIPLIISNHDKLEKYADRFEIPFFHIPITAENKLEQEKKQIELLKSHEVDFVVLARYMQILSPNIIDQYPDKIINIHHSFLPAFPGAKPYHSAHKRGVKIIGATSHYVTSELDAGPIIEQDVARISHRDSIADLTRKGRDLEKIVLSRAIRHHLNRNLLVYENRTMVFA